MYVKFAPHLDQKLLPLIALEAGYQELVQEYRVHEWTFYQVVCCYQGKGWIQSEGKRYTLTPGVVLLTKPGFRHNYSNQDISCLISWICFEGYLIERLCADYEATAVAKPFYIIQDPAHPNMHTELMSVFEQLDDPFALNRISTVLYRIVLEYFMQLRLQEGVDGVGQPGRAPDRHEAVILSAIAWMRQNIHEPPEISALASDLGITRQHLSRLFQRRFGVSTKEYFTLLKLQQAESDLVAFPHLPVSQVAAQIGYCNPSHFSRAFKQHTGVSPNDFRSAYSSRYQRR